MSVSGRAIVIGGGHNGLVAAALLAGEGRPVVLLERHSALGGLTVGDAFHPGFTSIGVHHDTNGLRADVIDALGLEGAGLALTDPPAIFAPQDPNEGPGLLLPHDPAAATAELERHSTNDTRRYREYTDFTRRIGAFLRPLLDAEPPSLDGSLASLWPLARCGIALRRLGERDMMELLRIGPMCVADWLHEWFETERLSCVLALPALEGTRSGPWAPGSTAALLRLEAMRGRAVHGGPTALIAALETAARQRGVEIRTGVTVRRVRTEAGAVTGVELEGGETIDTAAVLASCDPKQTFLRLLPPAVITPTLRHQMRALRTSGTTAKVDLAIRGALRFACRPDLDVERARIVSTIDDMERAFDAVKYRRWSEKPALDVCVPTIADPSLAPEGHHVVSILAHCAPHDLEPGWTNAERERFGDTVVATLGKYAPDLADRIVARQVLTPVDLAERYGVTGGHVHHAEHALDQMIVRPAPSCARYATPIRGLFLCGSGSHPGGGLTGGPGRLGAAAARR